MAVIRFVDNSTEMTGGNPRKTIKELPKPMEEDRELWTSLLFSSGQSLNLQKSEYHVIFYKFKPIGEPVM